MNNLQAQLGWQWIKEGAQLFRIRPFFLTNLFFTYLIVMLLLSMFPIIGQILPILLTPVFTIIFMQATYYTSRKEIRPLKELFAAIDKAVLLRLVTLGSFYMLFFLVAAAVSTKIDGGNFLNLIAGQVDRNQLSDTQITQTVLAIGVVILMYVPFAMATWFSAPLIAWQHMGIGASLSKSFMIVVKNIKPFAIYFFTWLLAGIFLPSGVGLLLGFLLGQALTGIIAFILSMVLTVGMYCSFYPTYRSVFGEPEQEQQQYYF